jgi:hypothetical protein
MEFVIYLLYEHKNAIFYRSFLSTLIVFPGLFFSQRAPKLSSSTSLYDNK